MMPLQRNDRWLKSVESVRQFGNWLEIFQSVNGSKYTSDGCLKS
jgi:hypothetical protein